MLGGSSSNAQIFNQSDLREKIEDGTLRLPSRELHGGGKANFPLFLAGWRHLCLDAMDGETLQQKTTHKGRKNSKLQELQRQEGGGECVWNISEHN